MAVSRINEAGLNVNQYGNRNLITNGAMRVAQRGTSSTGVGGSSGYFTCDRWKITTDATAGRVTMTQESDGPDGFANSIKLATTTADTSIAAGELFILGQSIEAQDLQQLKKGTSAAESVTVSFYVKANASATYVAELFDHDNSRNNTRAFTVGTSWSRVELTFAADTTGALGDDNAAGMTFQIWLHAGSTYSGGTFSDNTWQSVTSANRYAGSRTSIFDSTSRTLFLTGVQLEVGDTATDFEHRTFADELARCQRYYEKWDCISGENIWLGTTYSGSGACFLHFDTRKRAAPTITLPTAGQTANTISFLTGTGGYPTTTGTHSTDLITTRNFRLNGNSYSGLASSVPTTLYSQGSTIFKFDAEL